MNRSCSFVPLLLAWSTACGGFETGDRLPDFSLPDTNPNSVSYGQQVSVQDQEGLVSAWYFAHAN